MKRTNLGPAQAGDSHGPYVNPSARLPRLPVRDPSSHDRGEKIHRARGVRRVSALVPGGSPHPDGVVNRVGSSLQAWSNRAERERWGQFVFLGRENPETYSRDLW